MLARMHTAAMYSDVAKQEVIVSQARAIAYSDYHDASAAAAQTYVLSMLYPMLSAIVASRIVSSYHSHQHTSIREAIIPRSLCY